MTKQELIERNEDLQKRLESALDRARRAEEDARQSDPYKVLERKLEEAYELIELLRKH